MSEVKAIYSACGCNDGPNCVDWGRNGLVLYGARNAVVVYDVKFAGAGKVTSTFCHHTGYVNSVRWVKDNNSSTETEFISTSVDGTAVVWTLGQDSVYHPYGVLKGHRGTVNVGDGIYVSERIAGAARRSMIVATGSIDCSVKIWKRKENEDSFSMEQTLDFGSLSCLCVRLHPLPGSRGILLACASGGDSNVHLFARELSEFIKVDSLVGHKDFVWTVDIMETDSGDLLLASGSQDSEIRLWRLLPCKDPYSYKALGELAPDEDLQIEKHVFSIGKCYYYVEPEAVLIGHSDGIYEVSWHPVIVAGGEKLQQPMKLLSSSMDKSVVIWTKKKSSNVWNETLRLSGEGGDGKIFGSCGSRFGPDGVSLLTHGFQGTFSLWNYCKDEDRWEPVVPPGGHFDEVVDLQWEPCGNFLFSVSKDQTTRVHAPWIRSKNYENITWHQLARPQVHGHDMSCVAVLSCSTFASGAEEKIVRVFEAPRNFLGIAARLCKVKSEYDDKDDRNLPYGATVTELGLSNKAVYNESSTQKNQYPVHEFVHLGLEGPPTEEFLLRDTLWPERHKLYGHGYDIYALAAHPHGKFLASSCKAAKPQHATIVLWNAETWEKEQILVSHTLTVTQMEFSRDGEYLLSVSRDRRWSLFQRSNSDQGEPYQLVSCTDEGNGVHTRIIWTCSWSHDTHYFATGSRDGKVIVWPCPLNPPEYSSFIELKGQSVTAVAFAPSFVAGNYVIAVGLESGIISIFTWNPDLKVWNELVQLDNNIAHHLSVKRLSFRPTDSSLLASCGIDHFVKIYDLSAAYKRILKMIS